MNGRGQAAKAQSPVPSLFSTPRKAGRSEAEQARGLNALPKLRRREAPELVVNGCGTAAVLVYSRFRLRLETALADECGHLRTAKVDGATAT